MSWAKSNIVKQSGRSVKAIADRALVAMGAIAAIHAVAGPAQAAWQGSTTGTGAGTTSYTYNNLSNWSTGTIDNTFTTAPGSSALTLYLSATVTVGSAGLNISSPNGGGLTIQGGSTKDASGNTITAAAQTMVLNGDISRTGGADLILGASTATTALNLDLNGQTRQFASSTDTTARQIEVVNVISNGGLWKAGAGTLQLDGVNTYTGQTVAGVGGTTANSGKNRLRIAISGSIASTDIVMLPYSVLYLPSFNSNPGSGWNRISDSATITLFSSDVNLDYSASSTLAYVHSENFGTIKLLGGNSTWTQGANTATAGNLSSMVSTITFDRQAGAIFNVIAKSTEAPNGDTNPVIGQSNTAGTNSNNKILVSNASDYLLGGTGSTQTNKKIIPWVYGVDATGTNVANGARTFFTYDSTFGLRPLNRSTEYADLASSSDQTDNAKITASNGTALASKKVNSLLVDNTAGGVTLTLGGTLTVASGGLMFNHTGGADTITGGTIAFGSAEGVITSPSRIVTIASAMTGTAGFTWQASGSGSASVLSGDNTGLSGTLRFVANSSGLGNSTVQVNNNNSINGHDVFIGTGARLVIGQSGAITSTIATLTGGSDNNPGQVQLYNGTGSTGATIDKLVIGAGAGDDGKVTLAGGTIAPGTLSTGTDRWTRIGKLEVMTANQGTNVTTDLDLRSGRLNIDLASGGVADKLLVSGAITTSNLASTGDITLALSQVDTFTVAGNEKWQIATASSIDATNLSKITVTGNFGGWTKFTLYAADANGNPYNPGTPTGLWVSTPEPTCIAWLGLGAGMFLGRRRRQK